MSNPPIDAAKVQTHVVRTMITVPIAELRDARDLLNAIMVGYRKVTKVEMENAHNYIDSAITELIRLRDVCLSIERKREKKGSCGGDSE